MVLKGRNPFKEISLTRPEAAVTITTTVYIPELKDYWEQSLDVLKVCLGSLIRNTPQPYRLTVFDNGSCPEVLAYLRELLDRGAVTLLHLSKHNIGKAAAVNAMFAETDTEYVVYTDSDVLFRPGWLEESLKVFAAFDRVGIVSGRPWRPMGDADEAIWRINAAMAENIPGVDVARGDLIPAEVLEEHATSIHLPAPRIRAGAFEDMKITRDGVSAFTFGSHFQYTTRKSVIDEVGPLGVGESGLSKAERTWDERITALKYLRLALEKPLVHHLGNTLYGENTDELARLSGTPGIETRSPITRPQDSLATLFAALAKVKILKRLLRRIQKSLFEALSFRS